MDQETQKKLESLLDRNGELIAALADIRSVRRSPYPTELERKLAKELHENLAEAALHFPPKELLPGKFDHRAIARRMGIHSSPEKPVVRDPTLHDFEHIMPDDQYGQIRLRLYGTSHIPHPLQGTPLALQQQALNRAPQSVRPVTPESSALQTGLAQPAARPGPSRLSVSSTPQFTPVSLLRPPGPPSSQPSMASHGSSSRLANMPHLSSTSQPTVFNAPPAVRLTSSGLQTSVSRPHVDLMAPSYLRKEHSTHRQTANVNLLSQSQKAPAADAGRDPRLAVNSIGSYGNNSQAEVHVLVPPRPASAQGGADPGSMSTTFRRASLTSEGKEPSAHVPQLQASVVSSTPASEPPLQAAGSHNRDAVAPPQPSLPGELAFKSVPERSHSLSHPGSQAGPPASRAAHYPQLAAYVQSLGCDLRDPATLQKLQSLAANDQGSKQLLKQLLSGLSIESAVHQVLVNSQTDNGHDSAVLVTRHPQVASQPAEKTVQSSGGMEKAFQGEDRITGSRSKRPPQTFSLSDVPLEPLQSERASSQPQLVNEQEPAQPARMQQGLEKPHSQSAQHPFRQTSVPSSSDAGNIAPSHSTAFNEQAAQSPRPDSALQGQPTRPSSATPSHRPGDSPRRRHGEPLPGHCASELLLWSSDTPASALRTPALLIQQLAAKLRKDPEGAKAILDDLTTANPAVAQQLQTYMAQQLAARAQVPDGQWPPPASPRARLSRQISDVAHPSAFAQRAGEDNRLASSPRGLPSAGVFSLDPKLEKGNRPGSSQSDTSQSQGSQAAKTSGGPVMVEREASLSAWRIGNILSQASGSGMLHPTLSFSSWQDQFPAATPSSEPQEAGPQPHIAASAGPLSQLVLKPSGPPQLPSNFGALGTDGLLRPASFARAGSLGPPISRASSLLKQLSEGQSLPASQSEGATTPSKAAPPNRFASVNMDAAWNALFDKESPERALLRRNSSGSSGKRGGNPNGTDGNEWIRQMTQDGQGSAGGGAKQAPSQQQGAAETSNTLDSPSSFLPNKKRRILQAAAGSGTPDAAERSEEGSGAQSGSLGTPSAAKHAEGGPGLSGDANPLGSSSKANGHFPPPVFAERYAQPSPGNLLREGSVGSVSAGQFRATELGAKGDVHQRPGSASGNQHLLRYGQHQDRIPRDPPAATTSTPPPKAPHQPHPTDQPQLTATPVRTTGPPTSSAATPTQRPVPPHSPANPPAAPDSAPRTAAATLTSGFQQPAPRMPTPRHIPQPPRPNFPQQIQQYLQQGVLGSGSPAGKPGTPNAPSQLTSSTVPGRPPLVRVPGSGPGEPPPGQPYSPREGPRDRRRGPLTPPGGPAAFGLLSSLPPELANFALQQGLAGLQRSPLSRSPASQAPPGGMDPAGKLPLEPRVLGAQHGPIPILDSAPAQERGAAQDDALQKARQGST